LFDLVVAKEPREKQKVKKNKTKPRKKTPKRFMTEA